MSPLRRGLAAWLALVLAAPASLARADDAAKIVDPFAAPAPAPASTIPVDPRAEAELDEVVNALPAGEDQELTSGGTPRAEYDSQRITIDATSSRPRGFLGGGSSALAGADLYLAMDRPDLASRYRLRSTVRWTLLIGGSLAFGLGLYAAATAEEAACTGFGLHTADNRECRRQAEHDAARQESTGALVCVLGAVVFGSTWYWLRPDPVTVGQAKRIAWQHNRKLRGSLGVVDVSLVPVPGQLTLAPNFAGGGLGLRLVGSF